MRTGLWIGCISLFQLDHIIQQSWGEFFSWKEFELIKIVITLAAPELIRWSLKREWVLPETNHSKHEGHVPDCLRTANCHSVWETHKRAWAWPLGVESDLWLLWAVQPTYWHQAVVKESIEFIAGCQARRTGHSQGVWLAHAHSKVDWHQGEISSAINFLVSTDLRLMCLWPAVFTLWGICFLEKQFRNMRICVFLYLYLSVILLCIGCQPKSYSLFLYLHFFSSLTLEPVIWDSGEAGETQAEAACYKRGGHRGLYTVSVASQPASGTSAIQPQEMSPDKACRGSLPCRVSKMRRKPADTLTWSPETLGRGPAGRRRNRNAEQLHCTSCKAGSDLLHSIRYPKPEPHP